MSIQDSPSRAVPLLGPAEIALDRYDRAERCVLEAQEHRRQGRSMLAVNKFLDAQRLRRFGRYWQERCAVIACAEEGSRSEGPLASNELTCVEPRELRGNSAGRGGVSNVPAEGPARVCTGSSAEHGRPHIPTLEALLA
jgi:hypothetical protein